MADRRVEYIPLRMTHDDLTQTPDAPLPHGYSLRLFVPGDEQNWARITTDAEEFPSTQEALRYYEGHFSPHAEQMQRRCLFLLDAAGMPVGTATGWHDDENPALGRLHWVAIAKAHQGRGLCKPLVAAAMKLMSGLGHEKAMLTTQTTSWIACRVYLQFGWCPVEDGTEQTRRGWRIVREKAGY